MGHYCKNTITAETPNSEWREIIISFQDRQIEWFSDIFEFESTEQPKAISFTSKGGPSPWGNGEMAQLSKSYPCVLFHYVAKLEDEYTPCSAWFCNGNESTKRDAETDCKRVRRAEAHRFMAESTSVTRGVDHQVEIMPDGRVAADGQNLFGECNVFPWKSIAAISCGNWHTVGLCEDGRIVACGSNANGQCDISDLPERAIAVSCGRYHTAILLESGKVIVRGSLTDDQSPDIECNNQTNYVNGELQKLAKKQTAILTRIGVESWPPVKQIKSISGAVIGVSDDGKLFIDGLCPCTEKELCDYMGLN